MIKKERDKATAEWKMILKNHPGFARVFLSQQVLLIEASQNGSRFVDMRMCQLVHSNLPVLFEDYWKDRCKYIVQENLSPTLECISELNRDPARCFGSDLDIWFDDPLAGGRVFPPEPPPDPHI
jgi:hypothetical protein